MNQPTTRARNDSIELAWCDFRLTLAPAAGGSVAAFSWRGLPLFRQVAPAAVERREPLDLAGYPLLPFASRLRAGRFGWRGRTIQLAPNRPASGDVIHGQTWRQAWTPQQLDERSWQLDTAYRPGDWPWAYRASQRFTLMPDGFDLTLTLTNDSTEPMPAGLGWHPYLHRPGARLSATTTARLVGELGALSAEPHSGFDRAAVEPLALDHCFLGWQHRAVVDWPERGCTLTLSATAPLDYLTLWLPADSDCFCIEPVSHPPDAANLAEPGAAGWTAIDPGASRSATVEIRVQGGRAVRPASRSSNPRAYRSRRPFRAG